VKKLLLILPLVFLLCFTFGCQKAEEVAESSKMTEEVRDSISASVEQAFSEYVDATKQMDLNRMYQFLIEGDEFVVALDGALISGKDNFVKMHKKGAGTIKEFNSIEFPQKYVYVLSKDAAVITIEYDESYTTLSDETLRIRGSWIYVFNRINDEWKIVHTGGTHVPVTE
jgi:ketosteroid isomerase-like protein